MRLKSEQYFDAIQGMIDRFAMKKDLEVVYVTSTIPSQSIINALEVLEIPMDHIWFVDCISQIMMSQEKRHPHAIIVESPTMLENIMLKVEFLLRRVPERNALVVLDSINSLAIHNNTKILSEFLHILEFDQQPRDPQQHEDPERIPPYPGEQPSLEGGLYGHLLDARVRDGGDPEHARPRLRRDDRARRMNRRTHYVGKALRARRIVDRPFPNVDVVPL